MALGRPIAGTPFFLVVEFPDHILLRDANKCLRRVLLIDAALLMVGVLAAFALSRGITHPLQSLTRAASAISAGDYSRVVNVAQRDELGVLADAFNVMVAKLSDAKNKLEEKIRDQRSSEDRLQVIIENLTDGLVVSDLDGQLLIWNKAALAMHQTYYTNPQGGHIVWPNRA